MGQCGQSELKCGAVAHRDLHLHDGRRRESIADQVLSLDRKPERERETRGQSDQKACCADPLRRRFLLALVASWRGLSSGRPVLDATLRNRVGRRDEVRVERRFRTVTGDRLTTGEGLSVHDYRLQRARAGEKGAQRAIL